jgi:uncharacterized protein YcfL
MEIIQCTLFNFSIFKDIGLFNEDIKISKSGIIHTKRKPCPICNTLGYYNGSSNKGVHCMSNSLESFFRKGQQYCPKCKKTFQVENSWLDENINFIKSYVISQVLSLTPSLSEGEIALHLKRTNGISISKSTIHCIINKSEEELDLIEFEYEIENGFYCYDEQYLVINGRRAYRVVIFDPKNNKIIYEKIHYKFSSKKLKKILKEVFGDFKPKGFVVDMKIDYPNAFKSVFGRRIKLQFCVFHLNKLILKEYRDCLKIGSTVNWNLMHYYNLYNLFNIFYDRSFELKILKNFMKHHEIFIQNLNEKKIKFWVNKYNIKSKKIETQKRNVIEICEKKLIKAFRKILHDKKNLRRRQGKTLIVRTKESALKIFRDINSQKSIFPEKIQKRIERIEINFEYFIASDGEILTNNKLEGFFGATLKKFRKKLKKTLRGFSALLKRKRLEQNGLLCFKEFSIYDVTKLFNLVSFFS